MSSALQKGFQKPIIVVKKKGASTIQAIEQQREQKPQQQKDENSSNVVTQTVEQLSYEPPYWGAKSKPIFPYYLQVLKQGIELDPIRIDAEPFYIIGRNVTGPNAIQADHGSISRQHAIIQHASNGRVYLYDLGSTHGTFWNQRTKRVRGMKYVPLRLGDQVLLGESMRSYVLCVDPKFEDHVRSLEERLQKASQQSKKTGKNKKRKKMHKIEENEEEDYDSDQQYEYDSEEDRRNKRLRIEEQLGDENDVYGFDEEDEFFDRTVKKNESKKKENVETIETLTEKQQQIQAQILSLKKQLQIIKNEKIHKEGQEDNQSDPLDSFMHQVEDNLESQKKEQISKLEDQIGTLQTEFDRLTSLIEFIKPASQDSLSEEQRIAEIKRDRLLPDMFYPKKPSKKVIPKVMTHVATAQSVEEQDEE